MLHRRAKSFRPPQAEDVKGDINVTPLVDVCLVLLIIFMVVTPMLQNGVNVALPETSSPEKIPENQKQLPISIKSDGSVYVKDGRINDKDLPAVLADIYEQNPEREIIVKGDKRLQYRRVREVLKFINEAGFTRVGMVTERLQTQS